MARRPGPRDWQERAFEASQLERETRDNAEFIDVPNPLRDNVDLPRKSSWRWSLAAAAILVAAIILRGAISSHPPSLKTNCKVPGFALSSQSVRSGGSLAWVATGPPGTRFVIAIGVNGLRPGVDPGHLRPVPDPGIVRQNYEVPVLPRSLPSGCRDHGLLGVGIGAGVYNVRLFTLTGKGAGVSATVAATKRLTVKS
jgi:hypothetical protein